MNDTPESAVIEAGRQQVRLEAEALLDVLDQIDERFVRVASLLQAMTGKVVMTGSGTSGFIARRSAHLFSVSGTPAFFLNPGDGLHGSMGAVEADDVMIALSKGGSSSELNDLAARVQSVGTTVVAITANGRSPLGQLADITVELRNFPSADPGNLLAMGSTLAHSTWLDALAVVLMRARAVSWERVHFTHPGGAVGLLANLPEQLEGLTIPAHVDERG
ncbi:SIS domain-containing protein [Herbiconiux sp. CPCC 203407]|uniref:SIS domain-containing protein n=1 Tax=Herbiconiux oxytropis TaxID=2970915 RepID=A0AA41XF23_9MICO|nr:SIS domain-containing protein [Herbiconiux oxytropis]MCS5720633.1 SIS domain-containing protein [Herbiconiux oxytropis]MCS5725040.1 SIS domain-containing protein [Herbiconiux oxytropis]